MEKERARFLKVYADVPDDLRSDIIIVVEGDTYTWRTSFLEIKDNTELGKKILKKLKEVELI